MSKQSYFKQFSLVLFDPRHYQVLPLLAREDLGAMAMKGYFAFSKAASLPELHFLGIISRTLVRGVSYPSAEKQSIYF